MYEEEKKCIQNFNGKPEGNTQLGRPRRRWNGNIKMGLKETGREKVELLMRDRRTHWHAGTRF
jgi:hypothetical protein